MVPHIHTSDGVSLVLNGRPFNVSSHDKNFEEVIEALESHEDAAFFENLLTRTQRQLETTLSLTHDMSYSGGVILYRGEVLANFAADRLVGRLEAGREAHPLICFLEKLQKNPSKRVVDRLYEFLEKGSIPLTGDGDFLAYKAVGADFKDIQLSKQEIVEGLGKTTENTEIYQEIKEAFLSLRCASSKRYS